MHEGPEWLEKGALVDTLDSILTRPRPLVVAIVTPIDEWWHEGGGTGTEAYLDARIRVIEDAGHAFLTPEHRLMPEFVDELTGWIEATVAR